MCFGGGGAWLGGDTSVDGQLVIWSYAGVWRRYWGHSVTSVGEGVTRGRCQSKRILSRKDF